MTNRWASSSTLYKLLLLFLHYIYFYMEFLLCLPPKGRGMECFWFMQRTLSIRCGLYFLHKIKTNKGSSSLKNGLDPDLKS